MRKRISYRLCLLLCAAVLLFAQVPAEAAESAVPYIQQMIQYYRYYQEEAGDQIQVLLDYITYLDPEKGDLWETIMEHWSYYNSQMEPSYDVLPDGLPEDETLCIAVLGYALNSDGSMQPELVDRLEVALASAEKYPDAYIAVTGGGTAANADVTEAEAMADWLIHRGVSRDRLILETRSLSTTYNAVNTYAELVRSYPEVESIAVISSDYHVAWGCLMFQAVCDYTQVYGKTVIPVAACAANRTETDMDTMYYQVKGLCDITGIPFPTGEKPAL